MSNLTQQEILILRSLRRTAIVLLLMFRLDRPVNAREVSQILAIDYTTSRKYLSELSNLQLITHTSAGWLLTQGGSQLLLSTDLSTPPNAIFSRTEFLPSSSSPNESNQVPIEVEEEVEEEETRKNRDDIDECLDMFSTLGINPTNQVIQICKQEHITPDYIIAQAARLHKEGKWSTGMLIKVCKDGDPLPINKNELERLDRQRSYRKYM